MASTGSYSVGVVCDGWLYISGHVSQNLQSGEIVHGTIEEETRITLRHIEAVLGQAGCRFDDIVKCTCFLADIHDFEAFDRTYREFFSGIMPARTTVQSILGEGARVEIDAIARLPH